MSFDPYKVTRMDLEGYDSYMSTSTEGDYAAWDDFVEMREWWEERGLEIDRLYERLGKINEICAEGL